MSNPVLEPSDLVPSAPVPDVTETVTEAVTEIVDAVLPAPAVPAARAVPADRIGRHHRAKAPFRRWAVATLLANGLGAVALAVLLPGSAAVAAWWTGLFAAVTLGVGVVARSQPVVNRVFRLALRAPHHWPLRVRASIAQVHQMLAGLHVGASTAALGWFAAFTVTAGLALVGTPATVFAIAVPVLAGAQCVVLAAMAVTARPRRREARHDVFEQTHRWGSWLSILLVVALVVAQAAATDPAGSIVPALLAQPGTWIVLVVVAVAVQPWLRLRRVPVSVHTPSDHVALVTLDRGRRFDAGSVTRIARTPMTGWHSFANIAAPHTTSYRLAVSRAGGWTGRFIDQRPDVVWVRGTATLGMSSVSRLFRRVVWLATGSGIAPCIPHLLYDRTEATLVWVTRSPERTYGPELVGEVLGAQPDARLWNTDEQGKPDLAALAEVAWRDTGAEAVICISNRATTLAVVAELRSRGVPAFGPIWDS